MRAGDDDEPIPEEDHSRDLDGDDDSDDDSDEEEEEEEFELEAPPPEALRPPAGLPAKRSDPSAAAAAARADPPGSDTAAAEAPPNAHGQQPEGVELPDGYTEGRTIGAVAAAAAGALDLLQQQHASNPTALQRCDLSGRSCLVTALQHEHFAIVEWICKMPLPPKGSGQTDVRAWLLEERGIDSLTPLHHAIVQRCEPAVVEALLVAGADTEARTRQSSRYTDGSIDGGVERIKPDGSRSALSDADKTALLLAMTIACQRTATVGQEKMDEVRAARQVVRLLLEFGAELEARDLEEYTALHIAQVRSDLHSGI